VSGNGKSDTGLDLTKKIISVFSKKYQNLTELQIRKVGLIMMSLLAA